MISLLLTGVRPVDFVGNFFMSNTTDVEMAVVDCEKAFCCEIKHDDKLSDTDGVYIQVRVYSLSRLDLFSFVSMSLPP